MSKLCTEIRTKLALYYYLELPAVEAEEVRTHLDSCAACRGEARELGRVLGRIIRHEPDARSIRRVTAGAVARFEKDRRAWTWRLGPALAAAAIAAAFIFFFRPGARVDAPPAASMQKLTAAEWEMVENYDVAGDIDVIQGLGEFDALQDTGA